MKKLLYLCTIALLLSVVASCSIFKRRLYMDVTDNEGNAISNYWIHSNGSLIHKQMSKDSLAPAPYYVSIPRNKDMTLRLFKPRPTYEMAEEYATQDVQVNSKDRVLSAVLQKLYQREIYLTLDSANNYEQAIERLVVKDIVNNRYCHIAYNEDSQMHQVVGVPMRDSTVLEFSDRKFSINNTCARYIPKRVSVSPQQDKIHLQLEETECWKKKFEQVKEIRTQTRTIKGRVIYHDGFEAIGAMVEVVDVPFIGDKNDFVTFADMDGLFTVKVSEKYNKIRVRFIGCRDAYITIRPEDEFIEIKLEEDVPRLSATETF